MVFLLMFVTTMLQFGFSSSRLKLLCGLLGESEIADNKEESQQAMEKHKAEPRDFAHLG